MDAKTPAIDALLVHRTFLAGLARSLLHDEAAAEDVVQETYVRALSSPPAERGQLRSWLAKVTRNLAAERGRREPKVKLWETRAARPEGSVPSPAEIAEREAVRRQVVEALMELDDPSRDVLLLRFYEDLAPRHIARELGLPVETVRTRIKRGLGKLRDKLDTGHGGQRHAWAVALLPLAFPRKAAASTFSKLLGHAGQAAAPTTALKAAVLATLVLFAIGWWWSGWEGGSGGGEPGFDDVLGGGGAPEAPADLLIEVPAGGATDGPARASLHADSTELLIPVAPEPSPQLHGTVFDTDGETPLAGAELVVAGVALDDWSELLSYDGGAEDRPWTLQPVTTDAAGGFGLGGLPQGAWLVASAGDALNPLQMHAAVLVGGDLALRAMVTVGMGKLAKIHETSPLPVYSVATDGTLELSLVRAAAVPSKVRVVDEQGRSVPGAEVLHLPPKADILVEELSLEPAQLDELAAYCSRVTSDSNGAARIPMVTRGGTLVARAEGYAVERRPVPTGSAADRVEIILTATTPVRVRGRVVDARGGPMPDIEVWLSSRANTFMPVADLLEQRDRSDPPRVTTDGDGRFVFETLSQLGTAGWMPDAITASSPVLACAARDGHLPAAVEVKRAPEHTDAEEVELVLRRGGTIVVDVHDVAEDGPFGGAVGVRDVEKSSVTIDVQGDQGRFEVSGVPYGPLTIQLHRDGPVAQTHEIDWHGEDVSLDFDPPPPSWPLTVTLRDPDGELVAESLPADLGGTLFPLRVRVVAYPSDPSRLHASEDGRLIASGRHSSRSAEAIPREPGDWSFGLGDSWSSDGAWIVVWAAERSLTVERVAYGASGVTLTVDVEPVAAQVCKLVVRPVDAETGEKVGGRVLVLDPATGAVIDTLWAAFSDGRIEGELARPGTYDLRVVGHGHAYAMVEGVTVEAGESVGPIEVRLERPSTVSLDLRGAPADGSPVFVRLFDPRGRYVAGSQAMRDHVDIGGLARGSYQVHATTRDGRVGTTWVELAGPGPVEAELALEPAKALAVGVSAEQAAAWAGGRIEVTDDGGRLLLDFGLDEDDAVELSQTPRRYGLLPGRYRVIAYGLGFDPIDRTVIVGEEDVSLVLE